MAPQLPHHIVHRGHDRKAVFTDEDDYLYYLANLRRVSASFGIAVYAYCLMTNHVHLVVNPGARADALASLMKRLAGRQTRRVNRLVDRTGTLWEGRYRSSPIETDAYLTACCRYVELNPVRAAMVSNVADYPWSSYRERASPMHGWLEEDEAYRALGLTRGARATSWRKLVAMAVPDGEWSTIRRSVQRGEPTGSQRFADELSRASAGNPGDRSKVCPR